MRTKIGYHGYAAYSCVSAALNYALTRLTADSLSAYSLGFLRYALAAAVFAVMLLAFRAPLPKPRDIPRFALAGFTGFALYIVAFNKSLETLEASACSVLLATAPIMTALIARIFFHEALTALQWACMGAAFLGVGILCLGGRGVRVDAGVFWALLAALAFSAYNVMQRRLTRAYSSLQTTAYCMILSFLMLTPFAPRAVSQLSRAPDAVWVCVAVLGIPVSALSGLSWAKALALAPKASQVTNYMFLCPLVSGVVGFYLMGELPTLQTVLGGGIILAGALAFHFAEPGGARGGRKSTYEEG